MLSWEVSGTWGRVAAEKMEGDGQTTMELDRVSHGNMKGWGVQLLQGADEGWAPFVGDCGSRHNSVWAC